MLGWILTTRRQRVETSVTLTEVEAYQPDDPASHSYRGRRPANRSMFCQPGTLYVYRSHGIHWCANVVTGPVGEGAAVLLRAGLPVVGETTMVERRGRAERVATGPGNLCQALGITGQDDGIDLLDDGLISLRRGEPMTVTAHRRIGITRAADRPWRFVAGH